MGHHQPRRKTHARPASETGKHSGEVEMNVKMRMTLKTMKPNRLQTEPPIV
jgi:hypothetical protein